jgi:hypothetical protein
MVDRVPSYGPVVMNEQGQTYLVRNYTEDQAGKEIRQADVARPNNHRSSGPHTNDDYGWKNTDHSPTYGACFKCWSSGPVGKECSRCERERMFFLVVRCGDKIIDAEYLSAMLGADHEVARADRVRTWSVTPCGSVTRDGLRREFDRYLRRLMPTNSLERARVAEEMVDNLLSA